MGLPRHPHNPHECVRCYCLHAVGCGHRILLASASNIASGEQFPASEEQFSQLCLNDFVAF